LVKPLKINGKVALITGASSGFGLLAALRLAKRGWIVFAGYRNEAAASSMQRQANEAGVGIQVRPIKLDVTREEDVVQAIGQIQHEAGRLDALVNNAGIAVGGFLEELPLSEWRRQFDTNLFGVIAVTRAALPMLRSSKGRIVMIGSVSGHIGFPALGPYCASKHALSGLAESLRLELASVGVAVSIVEPGPYRTAIWRKGMADITPPAADSPYAKLLDRLLPMFEQSAKRGGDPQRVAAAIARALRARRPKLRYMPTMSERMTLAAKRFLPWSWMERASLRILGVKRGE